SFLDVADNGHIDRIVNADLRALNARMHNARGPRDERRTISLIGHLRAEVEKKIDRSGVTKRIDIAAEIERMVSGKIGSPTPSLCHRNREQLRQLDDV